MFEICPKPFLPDGLFAALKSPFANHRFTCHPIYDLPTNKIFSTYRTTVQVSASSVRVPDSVRASRTPLSLQECLDRVGAPDHDTITIFAADLNAFSISKAYKRHAKEALRPSKILTWDDAFGLDWLLVHSSTLQSTHSWIPEARSYYALASRACGDVRVLMQFRRQPQDPYQDGRASPWSSYVYPTLTRNPLVSSIVVIDPITFSRTRVIWRRGDEPFGRVPYLGEVEAHGDTSSSRFVTELIVGNHAIPSIRHPTVFWSSFCEDTEKCLNKSEAIVKAFVEAHLHGEGAHWFNLASIWGIDVGKLPSKQLSGYLGIMPGSPCFHDPGNTAVLEADTAQGTVYVLLPRGADLGAPNKGVKKTCWWCDCELSVLTRNLKVAKIIRVDYEDFDIQEMVWTKGDPPIGKSPFQ